MRRVKVIGGVDAKAMSRGRRRRVAAIIGGLVLVGCLGWFLAVEPSIIGFAVVAAIGVAWCIWLGRHPEPRP
jgi:hypothetical protein